MAETNVDNRKVGFWGSNIFDNPKVAQTLSSNSKAINTALNTKSTNTNVRNTDQPGFFDRIKSNFKKDCDCSCDKPKKISVSNGTVHTNVQNSDNRKTNSNDSSKNQIRLFGSIRNEKGYVLLIVQWNSINTSLDGGKFGMNMKTLLELKKNVPKISNVEKQISAISDVVQKKTEKGKGMFGVLKDAYKKKNEVLQAVKQGDLNVVSNTIRNTTGVNISRSLNGIQTTNAKRNLQQVSTPNSNDTMNNENTNNKVNVNTNTKSTNSVNVNTNTNINSNSNVMNNIPVILALKVRKTQSESKRNIPSSILSILDYLITYKGIEFDKIKSLDEMSEAIMSFFSIKEPQSVFDIFQQCGKVFGEIGDISGIKSLCRDNNIISFSNTDMNEWDVFKILYNELITLNEQSVIDIEFFKSILGKIKDICGEVQRVNLTKINKYFVNKLKGVIEEQCNNIEALSITGMEKIKQSFIDMVCSKDNKYKELENFLIIYFNFFLNDLLTGALDTTVISTMLEQQVHVDVGVLNKAFTTDKNMVLYVNPETIQDFLDKFSNDKIVINL